jgi:hypothetical protein
MLEPEGGSTAGTGPRLVRFVFHPDPLLMSGLCSVMASSTM